MIEKTLEQLYDKHQGKVSDKWSLYLSEYNRFFSAYRHLPIRMLEIGIQNGGSLEIWSKYFPRAEKLVGCDINQDCIKLIYDDSRISVVVGNANLDETEKVILSHAQTYDLIIDDGSHLSSDIIKSFARYFQHLADGGIFVAEDLHCSYWKEFEGGLFDPFSSVSFFKRLADIISYEHWGVTKSRKELLSGFASRYGVVFDELNLSHIHSVEFINSICVIRKSSPAANQLAKRIISGQQALVEQAPIGILTIGVPPDQSTNFWSTQLVPPDEDLIRRCKELTKLNHALAERDDQIAKFNLTIAERDDEIDKLRSSHSWRLTMPFRWLVTKLILNDKK